jgi:subtilisin family serine protease
MTANRLKYTLVVLFLLVVGGFLSQAGFQVKAQGKPSAISDRFIVVLKDSVGNPQDSASEMAKTHGLSVERVYTTALKGFSATIPLARLDKIKGDARVQFVSEDRVVGTFAQMTPTGVSRVNVSANPNKGTGIGVAVIDTGIDLTHPDLQSNIIANYSCVRGKRTGNDDNGHGSHVAGTIAALNNSTGVVGVAPEAKLIAVKVLNFQGSGTWSSVICGIDWVTANAAKFNIKVANMSLGGSGISDDNCGNTNNDALHKAICKSTAAGVTYVVAAGNSGADAGNFVPAAYNDTVITVSALADSDGQPGGMGGATSYGADDTFASFSNFGSVVDLGAPGVSIFSTWKGGGYNTVSGTSMASPHVAGSAALYIKTHPGSTWSQVRDGLITAAEVLNSGHSDPSGLHPESVVQANNL